MASRAFNLRGMAVGETREVARTFRRVQDIRFVDVVTGPYDVVAVVDSPNIHGMGSFLTERIHSVNGIVRMVTCFAVGG